MLQEKNDNTLPTVCLPELACKEFEYTGIDSASRCKDKDLFSKWTEKIHYQYNSRGFRDNEWPSVDELPHCIWCLGDSFTAGIGSAFHNTWPQILSKKSGVRVINVSMDGASNNWIARKCCEILSEIRPQNIVVMWSYLHRREDQVGKSDLQRRKHYVKSTVDQDYQNLLDCKKQIDFHNKTSNIVELCIPCWQTTMNTTGWNQIRDPSWPQSFESLTSADKKILDELKNLHGFDPDQLLQQLESKHKYPELAQLTEVVQIDLARDGHHFDQLTASWISDQLIDQLKF